jgi:type II secretory pathway pseudopilin PulG
MRIKGQTGMSLVEATIILLVLMLLTAVLAPSIFDYYRDAQTVKVKEDCEAIGLTVARLVRDVGPCLKIHGQAPCTMDNRADLLYSDGPANFTIPGVSTVPTFVGSLASPLNWNLDNTPNSSSMVDQFTTNAIGYAVPGTPEFQATFPAIGLGWRGAYLPSPIGPDPWGRRYLVNSAFLAPAVNVAPNLEGFYGWNRDVFCISAGPNQTYETPVEGNINGGTNRGGDDFIYIIQGSTR